jgi:broad specificity phosphatase PhoE
MTTILLVRHGETDWNREGRFQGWADPPLNHAGRAQARELAERLEATPFAAVYTSDLRRARETAALVAERHGVAVVTEPGLREIDVGSWSGLTRAEIQERYGGERPDGETRAQHAARVVAAVSRIVQRHPGRRVLVVTHGGSIARLLAAAGVEEAGSFANCAVVELRACHGRLEPAI